LETKFKIVNKKSLGLQIRETRFENVKNENRKRTKHDLRTDQSNGERLKSNKI
jgi:hypothetical protein